MPSPLLHLIFLFIIQGVYSVYGDWGVNYSSSNICALKGSTVMINCTYKYPTGHKIDRVFWTKINSANPPDLSKNSQYRQRIQYLGDKHHNCTIRLTDVRQTDSHEYYFRFITNTDRWLGTPGVTLKITDLQLESSPGERVTEGHSVTLTCKSSCSFTDGSTFIWFKNTQKLSEKTDGNNKLILESVSREDAGNYSCAVQGHKLTSPHRYLNVIYAPNKPVISIKPAGEIMEGDSVNLTCSSESNPPVHNYSWFKVNKTSPVGSGQTYIITNINSSHSGWFYCVAQNEVGSRSSDTVSVIGKGGKNSVLYVVAGVSAGFGSFIFILIIVVVWHYKHRPDDIRQDEDHMYSTITKTHKKVSSPESENDEEIMYATVQIIKNPNASKETGNKETSTQRSAVDVMEDQFVIYSGVK